MKKGNIIQWVAAAFIALFALTAFTVKGGILSGLFFLLLTVLVSPLRTKIFDLLPQALQKKYVAISAGIVLAIVSFATFPTTSTSADGASEAAVAASSEERFIDLSEVSSEASTVADEETITALSFSDNNDIELTEGDEISSGYLEADIKDGISVSEDDVTFVCVNPEIATIKFTALAGRNRVYYTVTGLSEGETEIYALSKDGTKESEHKKVTVKCQEVEVASASASSESTVETSIVSESTNAQSSNDNADSTATQTDSVAEQTPATTTQTVDATSGADSNGNSGNGNGDNFNTYNNVDQQNTTESYVLNTNTKKFHRPSCSKVPKISPQNYGTSSDRQEILAQGYEPCKICNP